MNATEMLDMPFIICKTNGGVYDDDSFAAGFELACLFRDLSVLNAVLGESLCRTVRRNTLPQVELLAMDLGFLLEEIECDNEECNDENCQQFQNDWATLFFLRDHERCEIEPIDE